MDLSHPLTDGMPTYPGLPSPRIRPLLAHEAPRPRSAGRAEFTITHLEMVGNVGTYLDSPYHRFRQAPDVSGLDLASLVGLDAVVLAAVPDGRALQTVA
ncbi:MAG TPA: cyclase family protein [Nitriliruptorales bacterium]|nr:cyclase family protein [Nitriliruptorales bacterium]